jgi:hypothetical protein
MSGQGAPSDSEALLARLRRDTLMVGVALAAAALAFWPGDPRRAAGVLGGLTLMALSYTGVRAGVDALVASAAAESEPRAGAPAAEDVAKIPGDLPQPRPSRGFVKFFTRHAILALGAYVMIARFEFHPVAMLVGVTAPAVAAGIEFVRSVRARGTGPHSRSS